MIAKHKLPATVIYENKTVLHFLIKKDPRKFKWAIKTTNK